MRNYYQINGFLKHSEEDIYNEGCQPNSGVCHHIDYLIQNENIDDLIKKAMDFIGITDKQNVLLNACDENGRIDFQVYEDSDGCSVSNSTMEKWKEGKTRIWLCDYSCRVSYISENDEIDLVPIVKDATQYTLNS